MGETGEPREGPSPAAESVEAKGDELSDENVGDPADGAPEDKPAYPIESVDNALRLLMLFHDHEVIRVAEASEALGVARSTAHRILAMLQYRGFAVKDPSTKAYKAGSALRDIGLAAVRRMDLRSVTRPYLEGLRDEVGETAHLVVLQGTNVMFLDCAESSKALRVASRTGMTLPAHCTSVGKALLAELSTEHLRQLYPGNVLPGVTPNSVTSRVELEAELARTRQLGYSTNAGESELGVSSVGTVIPDAVRHPPFAAISIAAPTVRMDERRVRVVGELVRRTATAIGAALE